MTYDLLTRPVILASIMLNEYVHLLVAIVAPHEIPSLRTQLMSLCIVFMYRTPFKANGVAAGPFPPVVCGLSNRCYLPKGCLALFIVTLEPSIYSEQDSSPDHPPVDPFLGLWFSRHLKW
jgi:hypothetical protein